MRTLEYGVMGILTYHLVRMWWRLNRGRVQSWIQRAKDHCLQQRHPKPPQDCVYCCRGLRLETLPLNRDVAPWSGVKSRHSHRFNQRDGFC